MPRSTLSYTDRQWVCNRPLSSYGQLPLRVVLDFTGNFVAGSGGGVVLLTSGCIGDSNSNTVDLILDVRGNGQTRGSGDDAIRVAYQSPGATNIQITGKANCGKKQGGGHQDGIQALGGTNLTFVDFEIGDYDSGYATCQGAGGAAFWSGERVSNMRILRGKFIACNHAVIDGYGLSPRPTGSMTGTRFRAHRHFQNTSPSVPNLCREGSGGPYATGASDFRNTAVTESGLTVQYWRGTTQSWSTSTMSSLKRARR